MLFLRPRPTALALLLLGIVGGCGGGGGGGTAQGEPAGSMRTLSLIPFKDPSTDARQRWKDIDDRPFSEQFVSEFKYSEGQVKLSYEPNPKAQYFIGHIEARGLKPNFSYQLKLVGKPQNGVRGWGEKGDDWSNQAIGSATRWWNDTVQANSTDESYKANLKLEPNLQYTIYGYDYMGEFVTDASGNASLDFNGSKAYHISWQDKQDSSTDKLFGIFHIGSTVSPYYGYGKAMPTESIRLWYEWEKNRNHDVKLPSGVYHCRFFLTEESFHAVDAETGGKWQTVLASEDFDAEGKPDDSTDNDIVFTVK